MQSIFYRLIHRKRLRTNPTKNISRGELTKRGRRVRPSTRTHRASEYRFEVSTFYLITCLIDGRRDLIWDESDHRSLQCDGNGPFGGKPPDLVRSEEPDWTKLNCYMRSGRVCHCSSREDWFAISTGFRIFVMFLNVSTKYYDHVDSQYFFWCWSVPITL